MGKRSRTAAVKRQGKRHVDVLNEMQSRRSTAYAEIRQQIIVDGACLAANEVFHMGPGRTPKFVEALINNVNAIAELFVEDDDPELVYAKTKLDERLKQIVGPENFCPYDIRYGTR